MPRNVRMSHSATLFSAHIEDTQRKNRFSSSEQLQLRYPRYNFTQPSANTPCEPLNFHTGVHGDIISKFIYTLPGMGAFKHPFPAGKQPTSYAHPVSAIFVQATICATAHAQHEISAMQFGYSCCIGARGVAGIAPAPSHHEVEQTQMCLVVSSDNVEIRLALILV